MRRQTPSDKRQTPSDKRRTTNEKRQVPQLYGLWELGEDGHWHRAHERLAYPKQDAVRIFQNALLQRFMTGEGGARELRPVGHKYRAPRIHLIQSRTRYDATTGEYGPCEWYDDTVTAGDTIVHDVAAPGIGRVYYVVTHKDDAGTWGVMVRSTVRELTPEETR